MTIAQTMKASVAASDSVLLVLHNHGALDAMIVPLWWPSAWVHDDCLVVEFPNEGKAIVYPKTYEDLVYKSVS